VGSVYCAVGNGCLSETVYVSSGSSLGCHQAENEERTVQEASSVARFSFMHLYFLPYDGRKIETCRGEITA
jgi:hypothetical protein